MESKDRKGAREPLDAELEARVRRADFSGKAPGLLQRLWAKIQARIDATDDNREIPEELALSPEEMALLTAARGNPFEGLGKLPMVGKKT